MSRPNFDSNAEVRGSRSPSPADDAEAPARGAAGLLLDPVFGPFFVGKLVSMAGMWVFNIVGAIVVWDLSHSTLTVGAISGALFLPQLLFAPLSGAQADRGNPKTQLLVGRFLVVIASAALAGHMAIQGPQGLAGPGIVIVVAAAVGCGFVIGGPAMHSVLPTLVRPSELSRAVALNTMPPTIARAAGPIFGGLLYVSVGPAWAFAFTSLTNLAFGVILACLPLGGRVARAASEQSGVRVALAYVREDRHVVFLLVGMLAVGLGSDPVITLTPALAAALSHGDDLVAALAVTFGVGAAAGYLGLGALGRRFGEPGLSATGYFLMAMGLVVAGVAGTPTTALVGFGVSGLGFCWAFTGGTTRLYRRVPATLRGRIMALWSMTFIGSRPLGAFMSGALADAATARGAMLVVATVVAALGVVAHFGTRTL